MSFNFSVFFISLGSVLGFAGYATLCYVAFEWLDDNRGFGSVESFLARIASIAIPISAALGMIVK